MTEEIVAGSTRKIVTRADQERAWRARVRAALLHAGAMHANALGWPVDSYVLDDMEIRVRLEQIVYDAIANEGTID